ncbi:MAG: hypothetical protein J0G30_03695 [Actinomycetales bacterium]|nr:hypothetical protein [Actinomycetales bacterium]
MSRLPALLLAPVVLAQATVLRRRTPELEPVIPNGVHRLGAHPEGVVAIGDSTVVGNGLARAADTSGSGFADALGASGVTVAGRSGATAGEVLAEFGATVPAEARAVLVLVGWNDAMRLHGGRRFRRELGALLDALRAAAPRARIVLAEPPRFGAFPVLPQPLRAALGAHATGLTRIARSLAAERGIPTVAGLDGTSTVADGFHPDAEAARDLGTRAAAALR